MKILIIADPGSVHAGKFQRLLRILGHECRTFAIEEYFALDEHFYNQYIYIDQLSNPNYAEKATFDCNRNWPQSIWIFIRIKRILQRRFFHEAMDKKYKKRFEQMASLLTDWEPDLVFTLKLQNEGYFFSLFLEKYQEFSRFLWIHFVWGTDLEYFGKQESMKWKHEPLIKLTLSKCKYIITDTFRDAKAVFDFGFNGEVLTTTLAFGGFESEDSRTLERSVSNRNIILVKGREGGLVGKASLVVEALQNLNTEVLAPYEIHFIMVTPELRPKIESLQKTIGVTCVMHSRISHSNIVALMRKSTVTISASTVDGSPAFLLESMAYGAVPIHTDQESIREWVQDGSNGFLFKNNRDDIVATISRALSMKYDFSEIVKSNRLIIQRFALESIVGEKIQNAIMIAKSLHNFT